MSVLSNKGYVVKTSQFEGPLDLLLSCIEKRKLPINDVSLSRVTDDFIAYINSKGEFPMGESADFILIASTLLLIKSKSLLPTLELTEEERGNIEDLEIRLREYKKYKELGEHLKKIFGKKFIFLKNPSRSFTPIFSPDESVVVKNLYESALRVLSSVPKQNILPKVNVKKTVSLEEMIQDLTVRINSNLRMSFKEFSESSKKERVHVIVSFLALLELVKQGTVDAHQENHFEDIHMQTSDLGVPKYT